MDECNRDAAMEEFTGPEAIGDGLGPIFNAAGCGECHLVPVLGGGSQIAEKRAGRFLNNIFTDHPGGSLIQDRANSGANPGNRVPWAQRRDAARIDPCSGRGLRGGDRQYDADEPPECNSRRRSAARSSASRFSSGRARPVSAASAGRTSRRASSRSRRTPM